MEVSPVDLDQRNIFLQTVRPQRNQVLICLEKERVVCMSPAPMSVVGGPSCPSSTEVYTEQWTQVEIKSTSCSVMM